MNNTNVDDETDLSRQISNQTLLSDDAISCSSFQVPVSKVQSRERASTNTPLNELLGDDGPSMFDENNAVDASNPQSLSAAPLPVLQNIIDYHGAVELVKRLSTALAERDAHITALIRLAEEYKVPSERIRDAASRVKQAERRRLSLATASEDLAPPSAKASDSGVCALISLHNVLCANQSCDMQESHLVDKAPEAVGAVKGITKLFGGVGKRRESLKP